MAKERRLRPDVLPAEPLRAFINRKVLEIGVAGVASATGLDKRRIRTLCSGYYFAGGRRYEIKGNTRYLIDRVVAPFGEHPHEVYGPVWYEHQDLREETDRWYQEWFNGQYHVPQDTTPPEAPLAPPQIK